MNLLSKKIKEPNESSIRKGNKLNEKFLSQGLQVLIHL